VTEKMKIIDRQLLDQVSLQARQAPRLRKNYNFHPSDDFPCHRLLNALEPGTYIRPHRHADPNKDESMVMVRGRMGVIAFDDGGNVMLTTTMSACGETVAVDIPHGLFHTIISLEPGSIFFESKSGPFLPLTSAELAHWAPAEGSAECAGYLVRLQALFQD